MRKFLIFCLSLVSVLALALGTTGCAIEDFVNQVFCEHEFNDGEEIKAPTCSEVGVLAKTCNLCGYVEESDIEMVEHTIVKIDEVKPTCIEEGLTSYSKCRVCDYVYVEPQVVPASGHIEVIDEGTPATCIEDGLSEGSHCSVCEVVIVEQEKILPTGHTLVYKPAVPATCTSKGLTQGVECSTCGEVYTAQVETPEEHSYVGDKCSKCNNVREITNFSNGIAFSDGFKMSEGWYLFDEDNFGLRGSYNGKNISLSYTGGKLELYIDGKIASEVGFPSVFDYCVIGKEGYTYLYLYPGKRLTFDCEELTVDKDIIKYEFSFEITEDWEISSFTGTFYSPFVE